MSKKSFSERYSKLREERHTIVNISQSSIESIQVSIEEYEKLDMQKFFIVTFSALFFFATAPLCFSLYDDFIRQVLPFIESHLSMKDYIDNNVYFNVSSLFLCVATPFYTIFMPFGMGMVKGKFNKLSIFRRGVSYYSYMLTLNYLVLIIPLIYLNSYQLLPGWILLKATKYWLLAPAIVLSPIPSFLFMIFLVFLSGCFGNNNEKPHLIPSVVINELSMLLHELNNGEVKEEQKKGINKKINKISSLIDEMSCTFKNDNAIDKHISNHFSDASKSFLSLNLAVSLPNSSSKKFLTRKVESIFNIFLTGNYYDLPNKPFFNVSLENPSEKLGWLKRIFMLISLGLFFSLPVIVWGGVLWAYNPTIDSSVKSLLPILYIIWCVVGIVTFSDRLAPDTKEIITDVFKLLISKK